MKKTNLLRKTATFLLAGAMLTGTVTADWTATISDDETGSQSTSIHLDGTENCHQLDQYEVDEGYLWEDANKFSLGFARGVTIPEYTANTYFTYNGNECTDHGTVNGVYIGNPCSPKVSCNCKNFEASIQCVGFARYVYTTYHGYSIDSKEKTNYNKSISSSQEAKDLLKDLPKGTFIKVKTLTSSGSLVTHFMIVSDTTDDTVLLYHANYGGNCRVRNMRMSYNTYATNFPYVYYTC